VRAPMEDNRPIEVRFATATAVLYNTQHIDGTFELTIYGTHRTEWAPRTWGTLPSLEERIWIVVK
jgi:hypothetical protein